MAPDTAVLLVLYAVAVLLRAHLPSHRGAVRAGVSINAAGALVALALLILFFRGIRLDAEHLGIAIIDTSGAPPIGHMSPVTALCFLLASLSFLALPSSPPSRPGRVAVAAGLAGLVMAIGSLLALGYLYGTPFLYGGSFVPPASPTSVVFVSLGTALLGLAAPHSRLVSEPAGSSERAGRVLLVVSVIVAVGIVAVGYISYRHYEKQYRVQVERQLSAIAELKAGELARYREERLADGHMLFTNAAFSRLVRRVFEGPEDADAQRQLASRLFEYREHPAYDLVRLLDARGVTRFSDPAAAGPAPAAVLHAASEVLRSGRVTFLDFYRNEYDRKVHLAILIPITEERGSGRPLGVLMLRIDPAALLYPLIQRWPVPSRSSETLVIRRDGNDALFLNELRFRANAALSLRISLTRTEVPAVRAVLGQTAVAEGVDYRGVRVIADVRAVPGSPWFLVSKVDIAEVSAPLRERLRVMVGLVGALLVAAGAGLG
ncbi:MAG: cache domain-containing protein, partial [Gemmatimonadota bacterium]